jgi:hypothetical protein
VGGRLTEDLDGAKNVDVSRHIAGLGAVPCSSVEEMVADLSVSAGRGTIVGGTDSVTNRTAGRS